MTGLQQRTNVERILAAARSTRPEAEIRQEIWRVLHEARLDATSEMFIVAAAATILQGGELRLPPAVMAQVTSTSALHYEEDRLTGDVICRWTDNLPRLLVERAIAAAVELEHTPLAFPPANLDEDEGLARARICEAFRLVVHRHYGEEVAQRGFDFMVTVCGELLAMALGTQLAAMVDPPTVVTRVTELATQLRPRVLHYQLAADAARETQPDAAPPPSRVM